MVKGSVWWLRSVPVAGLVLWFFRGDRMEVDSGSFRLVLVSWLEVCELSELLVEPSGCPCVNVLVDISILATSAIMSLTEG